MFGKIGKMMKLASEMKTRLPELQAKLAAAQYTGEASGGMVKATVNGKLGLVDLKIDKSLLAAGAPDAELLRALVKAAVCAAQDKAATAAKEALAELTGGMEIPGMGGMTP